MITLPRPTRLARRPRLLDLYCGAGGAGVGYHLAGFEVVGVDITPQPRYPLHFDQGDALDVLADRRFCRRFDVIHASPPCQSETSLRHRWGDREYPQLLAPTLDALGDLGVPWIVENVESTDQLPNAVILCGAAFRLGAECVDGKYRPLKRHRRFASSMPLTSAGCCCDPARQSLGVYGKGGGGPGCAQRGYKATLDESRRGMEIYWMNRAEISQAIPPAYTQALGRQALEFLGASA